MAHRHPQRRRGGSDGRRDRDGRARRHARPRGVVDFPVVVRSTTASDAARRQAHAPVRTCIGCRTRAAAAELLRVVVASASSGTLTGQPGRVFVVPDPRRRAPGRGAWLHRDPQCVALAQRRRAFARAFRVSGEIDPAPVHEYLAEHLDAPEQ
ncbi:MAG TPA: YlxR family protein [Jatrophihabitantaceae bacterium]